MGYLWIFDAFKRFVLPSRAATCSDVCHRHVGSLSSTQKVQEVRMLLLGMQACLKITRPPKEKSNGHDMK